MITIIALFIGILHVWIFVAESILWGRPPVNKMFKMDAVLAEHNRVFAFNQGFYNLFLALGIFAGIWLGEKGELLVLFCVLSVLGAGVVLFISSPKYRIAPLLQSGPALIYLVVRFLAP